MNRHSTHFVDGDKARPQPTFSSGTLVNESQSGVGDFFEVLFLTEKIKPFGGSLDWLANFWTLFTGPFTCSYVIPVRKGKKVKHASHVEFTMSQIVNSCEYRRIIQESNWQVSIYVQVAIFVCYVRWIQ